MRLQKIQITLFGILVSLLTSGVSSSFASTTIKSKTYILPLEQPHVQRRDPVLEKLNKRLQELTLLQEHLAMLNEEEEFIGKKIPKNEMELDQIQVDNDRYLAACGRGDIEICKMAKEIHVRFLQYVQQSRQFKSLVQQHFEDVSATRNRVNEIIHTPSLEQEDSESPPAQ